jgi:hypothetical protein
MKTPYVNNGRSTGILRTYFPEKFDAPSNLGNISCEEILEIIMGIQ